MSNTDLPERALIVESYWCKMLLSGYKPWEMRSSLTKIRGRIGLIEKGTGLIAGTVNLVDCLPRQTYKEMVIHLEKHRISLSRLNELKNWRVPWIMECPHIYTEPVRYKHPKGAVVWVKLNKNIKID